MIRAAFAAALLLTAVPVAAQAPASLYAPEIGRHDLLFPLGPIIAVTDLVR